MTEPSQWKVRPYADVGTSELFVTRISLGLPDVLDGTFYENRDEINEAIVLLSMECLTQAFLSLRELRKVAADEKCPVLTKIKYFDDMCKSLWTAYKDRMQSVTQLMGYDIGFLFKRDSEFEKGCEDFLKSHPEVSAELIARMKVNRATWQQELSRFRNNYLEHKTIKQKDVATLYSLERAEVFFQKVWIAIEELLVILMAVKVSPMFGVREIPEAERNPVLPKRFGWALKHPQPLP